MACVAQFSQGCEPLHLACSCCQSAQSMLSPEQYRLYVAGILRMPSSPSAGWSSRRHPWEELSIQRPNNAEPLFWRALHWPSTFRKGGHVGDLVGDPHSPEQSNHKKRKPKISQLCSILVGFLRCRHCSCSSSWHLCGLRDPLTTRSWGIRDRQPVRLVRAGQGKRIAE